MTVEISGVDADRGLGLCDGDLEMYVRFLRLYVSNIPSTLEKIRNVSEETLNNYTINVHSLKSNSEIIGAEEAKKTAKELEIMAKSGDLVGVQARNAAFIEYVEDLLVNTQNWLKKYESS